MGLPWMSALITREPKLNLKLTKRRLLRLKVRFAHLSVTLSNAGHAQKYVGYSSRFFVDIQILAQSF